VNIRKRLALFMIVVNGCLLAFGMAKFFYFHETVFRDFKRLVPQLSRDKYLLLNIVPTILMMILYLGLFWVILTFKERKWLLSGPVSFFCVKLLVIVMPLATLVFYAISGESYLVHSLQPLLTRLGTAYLAFTFLFVRQRPIRLYFWGFAIVTVLVELWVYMGPTLYDEYGQNWLLVNRDMIYYVPFVITMALFARILTLPEQNKPEHNPETAYTIPAE